jgi:uncharacterized protein (TIGR03435 family)
MAMTNLAVLVLILSAFLTALDGAQFDAVSIKPNVSPPGSGGGMRTMPDGSFRMTNQPIASILNAASPEPVVEVMGIPGWARDERYDIVATAPEGSKPAQQREMLRNMILDRMKLVGHVEQQERTTFALLLARSDGRLGPDLKPSTLDCSAAGRGGPPSQPQGPPSAAEAQSRCGMSMSRGMIASGGITMDRLVPSLRGLAGGLVKNQTGLEGFYALTLRFSPGMSADPSAASDDAPQFVTALQEQLGLKLQPEKSMVAIFVIDHIERPIPD